MSLKVTMIAVAVASILSFSGGFFVESKIASEKMLEYQKRVSDAAEAQRQKFEARRLEDERAVADALSQRDKALEELEVSRAEFDDQLGRMRSTANATIATLGKASSGSSGDRCERQLSELRALAKKSTALHYRCTKILNGIVSDYGKTTANHKAAADIVKKLTSK